MRFKIFLFFLLVTLISGSFFFWYKTQLLPVSDQKITKDFIISQGQSLSDISANLKKEGLIKSPLAFKIIVARLGLAKKMQAGNFRLSSNLSSFQVVATLTHGSSDVWVTFPEGQRVEEIAAKLHEVLGILENEFLKVSKEGYMFPDTYLVPKNAGAKEVAQMMMDNFQKRVTAPLPQDAQKRNLSLEQVVILASLVERETRFEEDRSKVAGILIKRWRLSLPLEVDATVQYALGWQKEEKTWWKTTLTVKDLAVNSPYNTRKNAGLPPGPIANPGLSSIKAVVYFQESPYFYYLSDNQGKIHYAKTLEEHIENINSFIIH
ncbi:hypothetical protein A2Z23_00365 [Candidatus Curtissbacteria bacterium RBG_16_39_7]|uniref:Endolytic murein transglycosylase n=1 Tax=Candidatus Curtissbacteria bacterium RBG_16_39_7 TaxID=1797707 RepID=A0A1F5G387_9BACT|nr:MAG: hypothetical protein A2Z23_00365 [Candidatus Curtissbacteria bacterium RBG_16_39_7]